MMVNFWNDARLRESGPLKLQYIGSGPLDETIRFCNLVDAEGEWNSNWLLTVLPKNVVDRIQVWNKLLTNEEHTRRGMNFFPFCEQCGKAVESTIHVVRDCGFVQSMWKSLIPSIKWNVFFNLHVGRWIHWNIMNKGNLRINEGERPTFFSILTWFLWKSRNEFIFNNASRSSHEFIALALVWAKSFGFSGNMEQLACFSKTEQGWQHPDPDWIKINIDGSVSISNTKATIGGVVRDSSGN
ncbi:hypothetical protein Godav_003961 [Gossypium davidsonii]|uniref:Reverse transcriptase zinc-binding domain-containing protein n=1 Tax=Gossypium davidsonii TaxID=34287 RepID=A0A7J8SK27_GOSDV|nr:hypothetical protein [Gossypium davidsonii]